MLCERTVLSLNAVGLTLAPWCVPQFSAAKLFPANIKRGHNHSMLDWCFQKKKKHFVHQYTPPTQQFYFLKATTVIPRRTWACGHSL
jgi:hypothetical protein